MNWTRFNHLALVAFCVGLAICCSAGGWVAARVGDWVAFCVLTMCAAASGWMAGAVIAWLREDAR